MLSIFSLAAHSATVTTYTTQAAYNAALPASGFASTFEDFSSVVANTAMSTGAGDVWNGFTVARTGTGVFGNSGYCPALSDPQASVPTPCVGYNANAPNVPGIVGSYAATTAPPATVTFTPTNEIFSFSFNHVDWNDSSLRSDFTVFMSDGTSQLVSGVLGGLPGYMGLILDQTSREAGVHITSILWEGITSELVGYWDIGTNYLEPELNTTKTFGAVTANSDFTIDVPITIEVENTGQLNVNNLQVEDVLNAATNFAGAYTPSTSAVTTGGLISGPTVSVTDDGNVLSAVAPALNPAFDGGAANSTILNGTTGALGPGDTLVINFTVRLDITTGGASGIFQNLATAKAEASNGDDVGDDSGAAAGGPGIPTPLIVPPLVRKSFAPDPIDEGDTSMLTIQIRNPNASALTGVAITDTYPVGDIINATPANGASTCGGTVTAADGGASVALSGATIPASGGCTITVNVTSNVAGTHTNTTGPVSTNESADSTTATDDLTVNALVPFCPAGSTLTAQVGNAVVATETGNVLYQGRATGVIETTGTNATAANSARLLSTNDELILDLGEVIPTNGVVTISLARLNTNASVLIEDSEDGAAYSGGQIFNAGPNTVLQRINYVVTAAGGAQYIRFTNQNDNDMWVDGVEYSQICEPPVVPPVCPVGNTLTAQAGNAVATTIAGAVLYQGEATGAIEPLGTNATFTNSARLRNANDELILDLGEVIPTNGIVTISLARLNTNAIVLIEGSEDGVTYSGGQAFGTGPNTALQRIDYVVTAAGGAQFIRFTNQNNDDMWIDGVEYSQICEPPVVPPVCPVGTTLTAQPGNADVATFTGAVVYQGEAAGAIEPVGTTATATNSALLRNANDELILDLGEVVPTNEVVTISLARSQTNGVLLIEDSEDGIAYSGGQLFGAGPNTTLQQINYVVTAAGGARYIRFTNQNSNNMWVDGVEYGQICEPPVVPPVCPVGSTLTAEVGTANVATFTGAVLYQGEAAGAIESVGTNATATNSARLRNANDELILDLGEVIPTNSIVTISLARLQSNALVLIEDSEDAATYSGGQLFGPGPNTALQQIDYVVTAAGGARYIRFTNQNNLDMWVDGVEYSQICEPPVVPPVCPAGTTLTAQIGNADIATITGAVLYQVQATGVLQVLGTNATAANSARLRSTNDELILDLGELVPTNSVVTISIARLQSNAIVLIEDSEDGVVYSGGQSFGAGPNTALQRIDYVVTAAAGAQFIRFTNTSANFDMWVDGVEYSEICDPPNVVDLTITKDDGNTTYTPGGTTTYTIVVTNNGPDDVAGATIADDLPDGVTMMGPWTCTPSSANSICNTAPNATDPISINVDIVNGDFITVTIPVQFSTNMGDY